MIDNGKSAGSWRGSPEFVAVALLLTALAAGPCMNQALAQAWPNRSITIVVPVTAGGPSDVMTRAVAAKLGTELKTPVVVENRAGAAGVIGLKSVLQSRPDGYTYIMAGSNVLASVPHLDPNPSYDVARDIEPIGLVAKMGFIMYVSATLPTPTLRDFVTYGKANPGKLSYASAGAGSTANLAAELLIALTGVDMTHVPYKGSSAAVPDLISGRTQVFFDASSTMSLVQSGQLRALGINSEKRVPVFPDLPTFSEAGYSDFPVQLWFAIVGPKGIPSPIVEQMNGALRKVLVDPELRQSFARFAVELAPTTPEGLTAYINEQSAKMRTLIKSRNISMDK